MQDNNNPIWLLLHKAKGYLSRRTYSLYRADEIIVSAVRSPRVRKRGVLDDEFVKQDVTHLISPTAKVDILLDRVEDPVAGRMTCELEQHDLDAHAAEYHDFPPPQPEPAVDPYHTGAPGRPTIMYLIERQMRQRAKDRELLPTLDEESEWLAEWAGKEYPEAPHPTPKTIRNRLRNQYRELNVEDPEQVPES